MLEKIALQKKLISAETCRKAVEACRDAPHFEQALKDYFLDHGLIPPQTLEQLINTGEAIRIMKKTIKFGTVGVKLGFITEQTLQAALKIQKTAASNQQRPKRIGQILLESGSLTREQIEIIIREQQKPRTSPRPDSESALKSDDEQPQTAAPKDSPSSEFKPVSQKVAGGMILDIEDDGMSAFLTKTDAFNKTISVQDIYATLTTCGIRHGIATASAIEGFIDSSGFRKNRFKIASGTPEIKGQNARIEYYFETDYLTAGGLDDEGNFDFKNRGQIPRVAADTLIAEKFDMTPARSGRNIFGDETPAEPVSDVQILAGPGVAVSEDGLRAVALLSGHPSLDRSGTLAVTDIYELQGDVGFETGHLHYKGKIKVGGSLKSGFNIKGTQVIITEIDGGSVFADGDVMVISGVNDAAIEAKGHVHAKFVHNSRIYCLGDVTIEKEIVDSTIECSGACQTATGEIINSSIAANQGVTAKNIGTERTQPCTITVGRGEFVINEIKRLKTAIRASEQKIAALDNKLKQTVSEGHSLIETTSATVNELDKSAAELSTGESGSGSADALESSQASRTFQRLENQLYENFNLLRKNEIRQSDIKNRIAEMENAIVARRHEMEVLEEFSRLNSGRPIVTVEGAAISGTVINSRHAKKELKETVRHASIREVSLDTEDAARTVYEIQIT